MNPDNTNRLCRKLLFLALLLAALMSLVSTVSAEVPYELHWTRQLGASDTDYSHGVAADAAGNVFISGYTAGGLGGPPNPTGGYSAFVSKYDSSGSLVWTRQLETSGSGGDQSFGVAADA